MSDRFCKMKCDAAVYVIYLVSLLTRGVGRACCVDGWGKLGKTSLGDVSAKCCNCRRCCLLFTWSDKLLVQSHYRGCTQAVYLCMGLCHCHSHSHAGYLPIFHSHIPICMSPASPPPQPPPSPVMNSFSHFSLPITSPSLFPSSPFCLIF